jgi:four helix bundle protein
MAGGKGFENLEVYRLSERIADAIWGAAQTWNNFAKDTVGKQIVRAADSIGANLAEGSGRGTYAENRRFIYISRGSLYETRHWLRRAFSRNLLTAKQVAVLKPLLDELGPRLNAYLRSISTRAANSTKASKATRPSPPK